ncbi:MAG TPA: protein kinase [Patescibacteria group bacterium]|nr:protein kinase [Patescibacteria group bacterium]
MALSPGSRLGPYEIAAPIGAGGMGEVYRARDTRLGRDVAIKVLPQHLSGDPGRRERFEREARVISTLNHPHICTLFDIGSQETPQGTIEFLVMEHIEGETLAGRLMKGALPPDQVLRTALEIADALDRAHRQGVIHRDLKPANVMLTRSGAKLLDFGLAKLTEGSAAQGSGSGGPSGGSGGPGAAGLGASGRAFAEGSLLATATRDLTTAGALLGTFQYMAPEQLEGTEADARTDIFAFGVLVYEMATGHKAFEGKSQASLIASVLKEQPRPISEWQPMSPAGLERVVRACLAKDPDDRVQTARDVKMQLEWVTDGSLTGVSSGSAARAVAGSSPGVSIAGQPAGGLAPARRARTAWLAAPLLLVFGALGAGLGYFLHPAPSPQILRVNIQLPPKTALDSQNASLALSPDGLTLAYAGVGQDGKQRLWVRALDGLQPQPLSGTENASYPFWSPDGKYLGFFADQKLKKVQSSGGTVQTLCDAPDGRGASWSVAGMIAFAPSPYGGLQMIPAAGGTPVTLTSPEIEGSTHRLPRFLPDGKRLLFLISIPGKEGSVGIHALDLATRKVTLVAKENSGGLYVPPGYLAFVREGNLLAQKFDPATLTVSGEATPIAEKVQYNPSRWTGGYAFSDTGLLVYQGGSGVVKGRLTWFDLDGKEIGAIGEPANFVELAVSPDLKRAVVTLWSGTGAPDLWLYDLVRGVGSRFTFTTSGGTSPVWSPDNREVAYTDTANRMYVKAADGATEPRAVIGTPGTNRTLTQWLPDGSGLLYWEQGPKTGIDLFLLPLKGDGKPRPILNTAANERDGRVSPDGRWLLYNSDESGRQEEYVVSYPGQGGKWQVSPSGAGGGEWIDAGRRIVYLDSDGKMMSVDVAVAGTNLTIGAPRQIFGGRALASPGAIDQGGKRVLLAQPIEEASLSTLVLMTDWTSVLPK